MSRRTEKGQSLKNKRLSRGTVPVSTALPVGLAILPAHPPGVGQDLGAVVQV